MGRRMHISIKALFAVVLAEVGARADGDPFADLPANEWVKQSPLPGGPPSPRLGYETSWAYDPGRRIVIRYGGHNQGGGGAQYAEVWHYDPRHRTWDLRETDTSPPGVCCARENVFDAHRDRFIRFPAFSGNHGWQWRRFLNLADASVWVYAPSHDTWKALRPLPAPRIHPLRGAVSIPEEDAIVVFGGEGSREGTLIYDPHANEWVRPRPQPEPPPRGGFGMAYDRHKERVSVFGSQFGDDARSWAYSLRGNRWRAIPVDVHPPAVRSNPVMVYDSRNRVVVAVVKVDLEDRPEDDPMAFRLETWIFDCDRDRWRPAKPRREPDPSGNRRRVAVYLEDAGVVLLENRFRPRKGEEAGGDEQQIWAYRFAAASSEPLPPPCRVRARVDEGGATLTWDASPSTDVRGYAVETGTGGRPWLATYRRVARLPAEADRYRDTSLRPGEKRLWRVRALGRDGREGPPSAPVRSQPPIVEDAIVSVLSEGEVEIAWKPHPEHRAWRVERAEVEVWSDDQLTRIKARLRPGPIPSVGAIRRIWPFRPVGGVLREPRLLDRVDLRARPSPAKGVKPIHAPRFAPERIDAAGRPYPFRVLAYRIRAINACGIESGPSPTFLTIPGPVRSVFARERGREVDLKWAPNAEKGLGGYRVYVHEGRWNTNPIRRVHDEPIRRTRCTLHWREGRTARWQIVAVDALGQEGIPSAPVWSWREWGRFYVPFTGPWHQ